MTRALLVVVLAFGCAPTVIATGPPVGVSRRPYRLLPPLPLVPVSGALPPKEQLDRAKEQVLVIEARIAALKDDPEEVRKLMADLHALEDLLPPRADLQRICDRMIDATQLLGDATTNDAREAMREQLSAAIVLLRVRMAEGYTGAGAIPR